MRYNNENYEDDKSRGLDLGRIFLLLIPIVNVAAAMVWAFASGDRGTRTFGKIAFAILSLITGWAVYFGISGVQELLSSLE